MCSGILLNDAWALILLSEFTLLQMTRVHCNLVQFFVIIFLDAIASPSTYPSDWVSDVFRFWRLLSHLPSLRACFAWQD